MDKFNNVITGSKGCNFDKALEKNFNYSEW